VQENKYVEMICHLNDKSNVEVKYPEGFEVQSLSSADESDLYQCYYKAFRDGDAHFFFEQSEDERRDFFNELELAQARDEPGSVVIRKDGSVIAFTYVIPYGDKNRHISCMVVHPNYQRQGLGAFMVQFAKQEVAAQGHHSITLGTDTNMGAYQLYRKYGFTIIEE